MVHIQKRLSLHLTRELLVDNPIITICLHATEIQLVNTLEQSLKDSDNYLKGSQNSNILIELMDLISTVQKMDPLRN